MTPFATWLAEVGLERFDDVFVSNGIDFDVVRSLSDADLRELGVTLGDRKRLAQAVARLDGQHAAEHAHPAETVSLSTVFDVQTRGN